MSSIGVLGSISGYGAYPPPHGVSGQARPPNGNAPQSGQSTNPASNGTTNVTITGTNSVTATGAAQNSSQSENSTQGHSTQNAPPPPPPPAGAGGVSSSSSSSSSSNDGASSSASSTTEITDLKKQLGDEQTKLQQDQPTSSAAAQLSKQQLQAQIASIEAQIAQVQLGKTINVNA